MLNKCFFLGFEIRNRDVKEDTKKEESNYSSIEEQKDYTQRDMYDKLTPTEKANQYEAIMRTDNRGNNEELYEQLQEKESGNNEELYEQLQEKESIAKEGNSDNQNIPLKTKGYTSTGPVFRLNNLPLVQETALL
nr:uncharacterized protein LOC117681305 isoform X3 [Crassostrea gigas]XP_034301040.1 uncharacterized protein LOC117681305 isoform X4 [Crassostrea gigas]